MVFGFFSRKLDPLKYTEVRPTGSHPGSLEPRQQLLNCDYCRSGEEHALNSTMNTPESKLLAMRSDSPLSFKSTQGSERSSSREVDSPQTPPPPPLVDQFVSSEAARAIAADQHANYLRELIQSIPPPTLHSFMLEQIAYLSNPSNVTPSSSSYVEAILSHLSTFFADLAPPPRLHCVRCHKGYFEVENSNRSCRVAHDDESAVVERMSIQGMLAAYETLWQCCGRTVEGDGDMGPPDGWCYEGNHTTDTKRARFRADSTRNNDKLVTCEEERCNQNVPSIPGGGVHHMMKRKRGQDSVDGELFDGQRSKTGEEDENAESSVAGLRSPGSARQKSAKKRRVQTQYDYPLSSMVFTIPATSAFPESKAADGSQFASNLEIASLKKPRSKVSRASEASIPDLNVTVVTPTCQSSHPGADATHPRQVKAISLSKHMNHVPFSQPSFFPPLKSFQSVPPVLKSEPRVVIIKKSLSAIAASGAEGSGTAVAGKGRLGCSLLVNDKNNHISPDRLGRERPSHTPRRPRKSKLRKINGGEETGTGTGILASALNKALESPFRRQKLNPKLHSMIGDLRRSGRTKGLSEIVESSVVGEHASARRSSNET